MNSMAYNFARMSLSNATNIPNISQYQSYGSFYENYAILITILNTFVQYCHPAASISDSRRFI